MRKKTARKSLIIMLAIVITIAMMPTMAFAGTTTGGGCGPSGDETLKWSLNESKDTLTITGDGTTMDNYTDGALTPWNTERASIKSVVINAPYLTKIGD
ncbi:MAG: lipocalin family protein, partial [Anaerovoracaceae bacterium]